MVVSISPPFIYNDVQPGETVTIEVFGKGLVGVKQAEMTLRAEPANAFDEQITVKASRDAVEIEFEGDNYVVVRYPLIGLSEPG